MQGKSECNGRARAPPSLARPSLDTRALGRHRPRLRYPRSIDVTISYNLLDARENKGLLLRVCLLRVLYARRRRSTDNTR